MHTHPETNSIPSVLREAKALQRCVQSDSLADALPVLRRLLAQQVLQGLSLPELYRSRQLVQRKHILRLLALEAGYHSWEQYRPVLATLPLDELSHFDVIRRQVGYPNLWFASWTEAQQYVATQGGRCLRVGQQAVVIVA